MARVRELTREECLRALATAPPADAVARMCAAALRAEPHDVFEATLEQGLALSDVMRKKLRFARRGGRTVHGGDEFVAAVQARGNGDLLRVLTAGTKVIDVALDPDTLQYVAAYLME